MWQENLIENLEYPSPDQKTKFDRGMPKPCRRMGFTIPSKNSFDWKDIGQMCKSI